MSYSVSQTVQQHPGTHEAFASKNPWISVALHVNFGHITAVVIAVLSGPT